MGQAAVKEGRSLPDAKNRPVVALILEHDVSLATAALLEEAGLEVETMSASEGLQGLLRRRPGIAIVDLDDASSRTTALLTEAGSHPQLSAVAVLAVDSRSRPAKPVSPELKRLICLVMDPGEIRRLRDLVLVLQGERSDHASHSG